MALAMVLGIYVIRILSYDLYNNIYIFMHFLHLQLRVSS